MAVVSLIFSSKWIILSAVFSIYVALKYRTYRRLSNFKGPFSTGWSEIWHMHAISTLRSHEIYKQVTDEYGSIARIGPKDLITTCPDLICHINAVRSSYTRTAWYSRATRIDPLNDHIFSLTDEEAHTKRRQKMAAGYSGKENLSLEPSIDARVKELVHLIRSKYATKVSEAARPMDLAIKAQYFTLDVISHIGYGHAFGDLTSDSDVFGYISASEVGFQMMTYVLGFGLYPIYHFPPIARLVGPKQTDATGHGKIMRVAREFIDKRVKDLDEGNTKGSDMMASFLQRGMKKEDIYKEANLQFVAGSDTTATAIRSTMLYLVGSPRVYARLQREIDTAAKDGLVREGEIISEATAKTLPYLQAVIREGLRIHPPITDIVPKTVPPGGETFVVDGNPVFLPPGTNIGYCVLGLARRTDLFGEDADVFRPERWLLDENDPKLEAMRRTTELIFGYGKYQCLGKPIAWMEVNKVLFELLRQFDWSIAKPENPWKSSNYVGIFMQQNLWMLATER